MILATTLALATVSMLGPPTLPPVPGRGVPEAPATKAPTTEEPTAPTAKAPTTKAPKARAKTTEAPTATAPRARKPADPPRSGTKPAVPVQRPQSQALDANPPAPPSTERKPAPATTTPAPMMTPASPPEAARPATEPLSITPRADTETASTSSKHRGRSARSGDDAVLVATDDTRKRKRRERPKRSAGFVLGYSGFWLNDALGRSQAWHMGTMQITPVRRYVRLNFLTDVGVEGGEAAQHGGRADLMAMQRVGLGLQYPHWVTPFIEFQGGVGAARVELFNRNDLLLVWSLGLDVGAQFALTRWLFVHTAIGWIRPVFRRPERSIAQNSFAFKVGIGF